MIFSIINKAIDGKDKMHESSAANRSPYLLFDLHRMSKFLVAIFFLNK